MLIIHFCPGIHEYLPLVIHVVAEQRFNYIPNNHNRLEIIWARQLVRIKKLGFGATPGWENYSSFARPRIYDTTNLVY